MQDVGSIGLRIIDQALFKHRVNYSVFMNTYPVCLFVRCQINSACTFAMGVMLLTVKLPCVISKRVEPQNQ